MQRESDNNLATYHNTNQVLEPIGPVAYKLDIPVG